MNQQGEIEIPELVVLGCRTCGRKAVSEKGSQMLCQHCVNEFLARNIGMMVPVTVGAIDVGQEKEPTG